MSNLREKAALLRQAAEEEVPTSFHQRILDDPEELVNAIRDASGEEDPQRFNYGGLSVTPSGAVAAMNIADDPWDGPIFFDLSELQLWYKAMVLDDEAAKKELGIFE